LFWEVREQAGDSRGEAEVEEPVKSRRGQLGLGQSGGWRTKRRRDSPVSLVQHEHLQLLGVSHADGVLVPLLLGPDTAASEKELLEPAGRADEDVGPGLVEGGDVLPERLPANQEEWRRQRRGGG